MKTLTFAFFLAAFALPACDDPPPRQEKATSSGDRMGESSKTSPTSSSGKARKGANKVRGGELQKEKDAEKPLGNDGRPEGEGGRREGGQ